MSISRPLVPAIPGFPIRLHGDLLYQWATLRLRRRPLKMALWILALGLFCWAWQWAGHRWFDARLRMWLIPVTGGLLQGIVLRTSGALFSALNMLSCVSIVIMAATLRHLVRDGCMDELTLVPRRFRPSALFYGIALRYLPLAFVVVLILFVEPKSTPFNGPPFHFGNQEPPDSMLPLVWSAMHLLSIAFFCPANLFMDLALSYWLMVRFRPSHATTALAVVVIGLLSPMVLVSAYDLIDEQVHRQVMEGTRLMAYWQATPHDYPRPYSYALRDMQGFFHYGLTGVVSIALALLALANLDSMWARMQRSPDVDPVLIRPAR